MVVTLLFMDATQIAIPNLTLFAQNVFGMEDQQISNLIILSLIFSVLAAFGAGRVSDKIGPKRTLLATLGLWTVGIMAVTFAWAPLGVVCRGTSPLFSVWRDACARAGSARRPHAAREAQ
jgi:MFS family permease